MVEITEGPELDQAVSEALGAKWRHTFQGEDGCWKMAAFYFPDSGAAWKRTPDFSCDLRETVAVAEAVGLLDGRSLYRDDDGWHIGTFYLGAEDYEDYSTAPTAALAICAGILKLKGDADGQ